MAYHIKQQTIETGREHQSITYGNLAVVKEFTRLLSHFDPFTAYTVMEEDRELATYWNGEEKHGQETETSTAAVSHMGSD
jgi:hypothetical protein